ncbi:HD-GYP domain-containing protein [Desulfocurvibacter africanus]|uniref:HD-GYP domain-containing protein n=1 Tax=Desulfocurvibacter africanus TaxID=873 RepID=UPI00040B46D8|nr:HD-GYP domain-containing protein [Desulfocurvibacter africanus]
MYLKVPVHDLQIGMYVVNTGLSRSDDPNLYSVEGLITSEAEIRAIKADGYQEVIIDMDRTMVRLHASVGQSEDSSHTFPTIGTSAACGMSGQNQTSLSDELPKAEKALGEMLRFVREFTRDIRLGKQIDVIASGAIVEGVVDSVSRNSQAMLGLCKLRSFDEYTYTHSLNVSVLAVVYGKCLSLPREQLRELGLAGMFHDVGKTAVPEQILNKPGKLTHDEFEIMKTHPAKGRAMLFRIGDLSREILDGVLHHHERHNGKGYPNGLTGSQLGLFPRIIGMVDVYDALTSRRCYKLGMIPNKALSLMFGLRGEDFEAGHLDRFIKCLGIYPLGSFVRLDNGLRGFVVETVDNSPLRPKVKLFFDNAMRKITPKELDLSDYTTPAIIECLDPARFDINPADYVFTT